MIAKLNGTLVSAHNGQAFVELHGITYAVLIPLLYYISRYFSNFGGSIAIVSVIVLGAVSAAASFYAAGIADEKRDSVQARTHPDLTSPPRGAYRFFSMVSSIARMLSGGVAGTIMFDAPTITPPSSWAISRHDIVSRITSSRLPL